MTRDGGPAFPGEVKFRTGFGAPPVAVQYEGMTLRDWFAGQALVGIIQAPDWTLPSGESAESDAEHAVAAYAMADAMIAARAAQ